jgi:hypothetical protein
MITTVPGAVQPRVMVGPRTTTTIMKVVEITASIHTTTMNIPTTIDVIILMMNALLIAVQQLAMHKKITSRSVFKSLLCVEVS